MPTKIEVKTGNLLSVQEGHIVHGCNAQGVMGSGVALGVKETYPLAYKDYLREHKENGLMLGKAYGVPVNNQLVIWNAITQDNFGPGRRQVSYDAVESCFSIINEYVQKIESLILPEIHIPKIGAARGGGNWRIIEAIIEETVDVPVILWLPDNTVTTI